jgi:hypothetical protein
MGDWGVEYRRISFGYIPRCAWRNSGAPEKLGLFRLEIMIRPDELGIRFVQVPLS